MARAIMLITILALMMFGCYYAGYLAAGDMGWFGFLIDPSTALTQPWYTLIISSLSGLVGAIVVIGSIVFKNDIGINAGITIAILTPLTQCALRLWGVMNAFNGFIANFVFGTMMFLICFTVYELFRGKD